tara:strand:+ start:201 stop:737 length:537 start_codon:yes stop_codon:yes gene_type:complete
MIRYAFADPPYLGCGKKHYGALHSEAAVWDTLEAHKELIERMTDEYDGWVYCLTSTSLQDILPFCPSDIRICSWVKPFAVFKPNVNPGYTWEPVLLWSGRKKRSRKEDTVKDHLSCNITLRKGLVGAKPKMFCRWVLNLLGVQAGDVVDDLFPGTGIMSVALEEHFGVFTSNHQWELF